MKHMHVKCEIIGSLAVNYPDVYGIVALVTGKKYIISLPAYD